MSRAIPGDSHQSAILTGGRCHRCFLVRPSAQPRAAQEQMAAQHVSHIIVPESMERHVYEVSLQAVVDEAREMGA